MADGIPWKKVLRLLAAASLAHVAAIWLIVGWTVQPHEVWTDLVKNLWPVPVLLGLALWVA